MSSPDEQDGLPKGWAAAELEHVAEVHDDLREPVNAEERAHRTGPYPYYGATGQVGWIDGFLMDGEYVLLGEDGAPFLDPTKPKAYMVKGKAWVNNHAHVLKGIDGLCENRFLLHALNHADYRGFANGTTRLKLTQGAMRRLPLRLPPPPEQRRIVAKIEELFSDLDAGVAALERVRANLKRYRASVLKAAVEGRLTARWRKAHPNTEPAAKLLERILDERRKKWEAEQLAKFAKAGKPPPKGWQAKYTEPAAPDTSNLPGLPRGWCWATVEQLTATASNGFGKRGQEDGSPTIVLRLADIDLGVISLASPRSINATADEIEDYRLLPDDLLAVRVNGSPDLVGRLVRYGGSEQPLLFCDHFIRLRLVRPEMAAFLRHYGDTSDARHFVDQNKVCSAGQNTISQTTLARMVVPVPPASERDRIVSETERLLSMATAIGAGLEHCLTRAARLRQSILKRAFEGKLVPQDPTDEPADKLLERMASAKAREAPAKSGTGRAERPRGRRADRTAAASSALPGRKRAHWNHLRNR